MDIAYLIHRRPYTDSKVILELFTRNYGKVSVVQRGAGKAKNKIQPQQFTEYFVEWIGRSDLKTLTSIEPSSRGVPLEGKALYCALYLNEILSRSILPGEECGEVFESYVLALRKLSESAQYEPILREFELSLLMNLGYAIDFLYDVVGNKITSQSHYLYKREEGFLKLDLHEEGRLVFQGADILSAGAGYYEQKKRAFSAQKNLPRGIAIGYWQ